MKRILRFMLAFVVIICLASCDNKTPEANLMNNIDSLSYSLGVVQTQGLKNYLVNRLSVDTAYIDDFIKGLNEGANAGDSKQRNAYLVGISIGLQICNQSVKDINTEVFGEGSPKTISLKNFMAGFIGEIKGNNNLMTMQRATEVSQRLMSEIKNRENLEINRAGDKERQLTDNLIENESEAEERAAREAAEQAERESKTWTGASSESELRQKLDGTSWETTYDVLRYKVTFSNGMVNMIFTDLDGSRYKSEETYEYEIKEVRGCFFVNMGYSIPIENSKDLEYSIVFKDNKVFLFSNQKVNIGELIFLGRN